MYPRKPRLIDLQELKQQIIVLGRKAVLRIVINAVMFIFSMGITVVTVSCHVDILLFTLD